MFFQIDVPYGCCDAPEIGVAFFHFALSPAITVDQLVSSYIVISGVLRFSALLEKCIGP